MNQEYKLQQPGEGSVVKRKNSDTINISRWIQSKDSEKVLGLQVHHIVNTVKRKRGEVRENNIER